MIIGLVFGGGSIEGAYDAKVFKEVETVLAHYNIKAVRIDLNNSKDLASNLALSDVLFFVNSNCRDISTRKHLFDFILENDIEFIGQKDEVFKIARNKHLTNEILASNGINIPKSFFFRHEEHLQPNLSFPVIVKDNFGSSSEFLDICFDETSFLFFANHVSTNGKSVLVEEYIAGVEITCPFVTLCGKDFVLNPIEIIYDGYIYDYKLKNITFRNKLKIPPVLSREATRKVRDVVLKTNKLIGCHYYSRIDMKIIDDTVYIIEINSEPVLSKNDFLSRSCKSMGISYNKLIVGLLSNSRMFVEYAKLRNKKLYNFILSIEDSISKLNT